MVVECIEEKIKMENKFEELRIRLTQTELETLNQIKMSQPTIKNNSDLIRFLIGVYQNKNNQLLSEIRNLKIEQATTNEALGELMAQSIGFRKSNDNLPVSEMIFGSDFLGMQRARKAAIKKVVAGREKKFDGKKK